MSNTLSVFYFLPKHIWCLNWVKSIAHDPALNAPKSVVLKNTMLEILLAITFKLHAITLMIIFFITYILITQTIYIDNLLSFV